MDHEYRVPSLSSVYWKLIVTALIALAGIAVIRWLMGVMGLPTGEVMYWLAGLGYIWINATTLTIGWRVFWLAYEVKQRAERRREKLEKKPELDAADKNLAAIAKMQRRGLWIATLFHAASAVIIFYASGFVTQEMWYRLIAVAVSIAVAIVRPLFIFAETAIRSLLEYERESQYPEKTVQDLIRQVEALGNLEERMKDLIKGADTQLNEQEKKSAATLKEHAELLEKERKAKEAELQPYLDKATKLEADINAFRETVISKLSELANDDGYRMACLRVVQSTPEFRTLLRIDSASLDQLVEDVTKNVQARKAQDKTGKNKKTAPSKGC